jgi:hypothetical protein
MGGMDRPTPAECRRFCHRQYAVAHSPIGDIPSTRSVASNPREGDRFSLGRQRYRPVFAVSHNRDVEAARRVPSRDRATRSRFWCPSLRARVDRGVNPGLPVHFGRALGDTIRTNTVILVDHLSLSL